MCPEFRGFCPWGLFPIWIQSLNILLNCSMQGILPYLVLTFGGIVRGKYGMRDSVPDPLATQNTSSSNKKFTCSRCGLAIENRHFYTISFISTQHLSNILHQNSKCIFSQNHVEKLRTCLSSKEIIFKDTHEPVHSGVFLLILSSA